MILLLDIGNSRIKWACYDAGEWLAEGAATNDAKAHDFLSGLPVRPTRVLAVEVVGPETREPLVRRIQELFGLEIEFAVAAENQQDLRSGYADPEQLGADRWLAMLAARRQCAKALCVVDAGTAITIDLVEADGRHLGGFILPGFALMASALDRGTGEIRTRAARQAAATPVPAGPPEDTRSAISGAAVLAAAGLIDRACAMTAEPPRVFLTGGDAPALLPLLPAGSLQRPRLVLEGLLAAFSVDEARAVRRNA